MMDKDEALRDLARAYLDSKVSWTIYLETMGEDDKSKMDDLRAETKYNTMAQVYVACGVVTWTDINDSWFHKAKIVVASEA